MPDMPADPFITPETLAMMKSLYDLYAAAISAGFPDHAATNIITGIIIQLLSNATPAQSTVAREEEIG